MTTHDDSPLFPSRPRKLATVNLIYHGALVALQFTDMNTAELEKAIDGLLARDGWNAPDKEHTPALSTPSAARRPVVPRVQPVYGNDGQPCCPTHGRALKEGKWGLFCSAKDASGEYCKLKFEG